MRRPEALPGAHALARLTASVPVLLTGTVETRPLRLLVAPLRADTGCQGWLDRTFGK